jgi:hypothetical protein
MRKVALAGLFACSIACGHDDAPPFQDPGDGDGDGDGDGEPPQLAEDIGIELASVGSFVVQSAASDTFDGHWRAGGQQLFALTLAGELIELSLLEPSEGASGSYAPPFIQQIHSTPAWVVFSTPGFIAYEVHEQMDVEIPCSMIAARRSDGALFCGDLGIRSGGDNYGNVEPGGATVLGDLSGELLYVVGTDELDQNVVYRVEANDDGLSASLLEAVWRPNWLAVNATGDLLVNYVPAGGELVTQLYPADGSTPIDVPTSQTALHRFGIAGELGSAEQDDFYLLEIENDMQSKLRTLDKQGDAFVHTEHTVALSGNCVFLHPLVDGIYTLCGTSLARVFEAGAVLTTPTMIPLAGVEELVSVGGRPVRLAEQMFVLAVSDGSTSSFLRHDGITQQTIPFGDQVELLGFGASRLGDIDFMGVTIDTHARVIGTVAAGADEVEILDYEELDPAAVIAFTRIN